jgi:hypothetical protein
MTENLPTIGAAMNLADLETLHNWALEGQRDLEIQDFIAAETLNGDWRPIAGRIRQLLDGYDGRLGIHGPFWGFTIDTPDPDVRGIVKRHMNQGFDVCEAIGGTHIRETYRYCAARY